MKNSGYLKRKTPMRRSAGNKFGAVKTFAHGILFDSKLEAFHYDVLRMMELAGEITDLETQKDFPLKIGDALICTYRADYFYFDRACQEWVVSDAKGVKTETFRIKWKMARILYPQHIFELRHKYKVIREKRI